MKITASAEQFLSKALGQDGLDALQKSELFKLKANKVVPIDEIKTAMQIVPRTVITLLHKELGAMKIGEGKDVVLPVQPEAILHVTKYDNDVYSGDIHRPGNVMAKFQDRSLPGVGLIIMSTFELYDVSDLASAAPSSVPSLEEANVQKIIDERMGLRDLVRQVVDQRITEREAIDSIIRMRLTQAMAEATQKKTEKPEEAPMESKKPTSKLKEFIERRARKAPKEFQISMAKNETVVCEDCKKEIFTKGAFSGCICYGDDRNNKIFITKNENGFTMRFPRSWDVENVQMLLETLRDKNRGSK
jgi:hypothetical protein